MLDSEVRHWRLVVGYSLGLLFQSSSTRHKFTCSLCSEAFLHTAYNSRTGIHIICTWYRENVANYRRIFSAVFFVGPYTTMTMTLGPICCYSLWPVFRRHVVGQTSLSVVCSCWSRLYWTASNNATLLLYAWWNVYLNSHTKHTLTDNMAAWRHVLGNHR